MTNYLANEMAIDSYYADINKELEKELQHPIDAPENFTPQVEEENQELFNNDRHIYSSSLINSGAPGYELNG
jgi:hypothetical protein